MDALRSVVRFARRLGLAWVLLGLAWAGVSVSPELPQALEKSAWPSGTTFALVDENGQVVWQPGAKPTQEALAQAKALRILLPDGTAYLVAVTVEGQGQGLGEVKLRVEGKLVPLPELLHAKGFTVQDGQVVKLTPGGSAGGRAGGEGQGASHGHRGQGRGR